jgi:hypothetical protein
MMDKPKPAEMNLEQLLYHVIELSIVIAQTVVKLEKERGGDVSSKDIIQNLDRIFNEGIEIPYGLEEVFIGPFEDVGEKQKTKSGIGYQEKRFAIATGSPEAKGDWQSLGDLLRERSEIQQQLRKKLLTHKVEPYIGSDERDFKTNLAASFSGDTDILKMRLRAEFEHRLEHVLKRYSKLGFLYLEERPSKLVVARLKEAIKCYIQGYFQSCAIMSRAVLETVIKEGLESKGVKMHRATLGELLEPARRLKILTDEEIRLAKDVKDIGDTAAHDSQRCTSHKAFEALNNTKVLLNKLFKKR